MKSKLLFPVLFFFIIVTGAMTKSESVSEINLNDTVYVCGKSNVYHTSITHSALDRCKSGITKMTLKKAKSLGKRACKCKI